MAHTDGFTIRRATHTDIDTLVQLMLDFYAESQYQLDAKWAAESFSALLSNDQTSQKLRLCAADHVERSLFMIPTLNLANLKS